MPDASEDIYRRLGLKRVQPTTDIYKRLGLKRAQPAPQVGGAEALWKGLLHGAGNILYGGAQIGARMGAAQDTGFGPEFPPSRIPQIDRAAQERERAYQASPGVRQHPILSGAGQFGGQALATAPLSVVAGPAAAASGTLGRMAVGAGLGAAGGALQPTKETGDRVWNTLIGAGAGAAAAGAVSAIGSTLGRAIAGNTPAVVDQAMNRAYRTIIKPSRVGQQNLTQLNSQDRRIMDAVDAIITHKPALQLVDAEGNAVQGQLPKSIHQFAQAIDQVKATVFKQYDDMAKAAGVQGAMVDLAPVVSRLQQISATPYVRVFRPELGEAIKGEVQRLAAEKAWTPEETQNAIQSFNRELQSFYKNPTMETTGRAEVHATIASMLREGIDAAVERYQGPGYKDLKLRYGALRSVERDVAGAVQREANKIPGGIGGIFADLAASEQAIHGIFRMAMGDLAGGAASVGRAGAIKAAKTAMKYLKSPNRAVQLLFARREAGASGPLRQAVGAAVRSPIPAVGAAGPMGGTVTNIFQPSDNAP